MKIILQESSRLRPEEQLVDVPILPFLESSVEVGQDISLKKCVQFHDAVEHDDQDIEVVSTTSQTLWTRLLRRFLLMSWNKQWKTS